MTVLHTLGDLVTGPLLGPVGLLAPKVYDDLGKDKHSTLTALAESAGFSPADAKIMAAIAMAESGGKSNAVNHNTNGTQDTGLWQINDVHADGVPLAVFHVKMMNPVANASKAHDVFMSQGFHAWSTYNSGHYTKFLGQDTTVVTDKQNASDAIPGVDALGTIAHVIGALANPSTYARFGKGLLGGGLIVLGVGGLVYVAASKLSSSPTIRAAAKVIK